MIDPLKGIEGKKWLSKGEKATIKSLKPYKGGDDILFSLHKLDIIRKHQRLVDVTTIPGRGAMLYRSGGGHADAEQLFRGDLKDGAPLWRIARNPEAEVYLPLQISFTEAALADRRPVREVLRTFAERATQVIALFD